MSKVVVTLQEDDLLDLQEILLDDDETAALDFLKTRIAPRIPAKGTGNCDSSRCNPYLLRSSQPGQGKLKT
jgi:hypothetical protein